MDQIYREINRYQIYLWPAAAGIVSVALIVFIAFPQFQQVFGFVSSISELTTTVNNLQEKIKSLSSIDETVYRDNLNLTLRVLPTERDLISVISQIQLLASSTGVRIDGINFSNSASGEISSAGSGEESFIVSIGISGSPEQFKNFLTKLRTAPRIMKVEGIDISTGRSGVSGQANFTLKTFYQNLPSSLGDVEQPLPTLSAADNETLVRIQQAFKDLPIITTDNAVGAKGKTDPFN
ncbi:MAG: hypothetical protein US86_C0005G0039 [Candidatus Daviesbacteria bacterium GW2011_GWA2_38_24]|uniref:Uncharacterized protein n=1 Tax=Candidatus Daviesbacteria bacterium GW2011_GWA2_38_24 TaxID=1618422 RepID=A0A0G0JFH9_9BACT|nr:MAG: hypothetical protein US86_C0005G0039 [Candidatus Daviesbacteria bacterium GW2011_GWA2_38_24]KKQ79611.1 MAG: hypothetical protein UT01_C0033G0004 [Candidatus Daviesbacteria bacterium GW2011_GWA1_38_7]OGE22579.1 MAG: hypothetical protein A2688_03940 [Candidatus Daviesbacteria bacterium RIFCSPHIGHO2_01_FULL_38_8]